MTSYNQANLEPWGLATGVSSGNEFPWLPWQLKLYIVHYVNFVEKRNGAWNLKYLWFNSPDIGAVQVIASDNFQIIYMLMSHFITLIIHSFCRNFTKLICSIFYNY